MNNIEESKNFIDFVRNVYDRSLLALSPKIFFPIAAGEFAKGVYANPLFEYVRQILANIGKEDFARLRECKMIVLNELEKSIQLIFSYEKKVPILSSLIEEHVNIKKQCSKDSYELIFCLEHMLKKACRRLLFDKSGNIFRQPYDHTEILKKIVKLDDKNNIIEFIFAPSLSEYYQEMEVVERNRKVVPYNSYTYLTELHLFYDIKNRSSRIQALEPSVAEHLSLKAKNFDQALEEERPEVSRALGFDTEECKIHMHRILEFLKSGRFSQKTKNGDQEDSYDEATGILIRNGKQTEFINSQLPSKILSLLHPNGKLIDFISDEDIYYGAIKEEADPEWYQLDKEDIRKNKRLIYQACRTINKSVANDYDKENKQKFLKLKGNIVSPNRNSLK